MRTLTGIMAATAATALWMGIGARAADETTTDETQRLQNSITVLTDLTSTPDKAIPTYLLERAEAIVVIPSLKKGGFIVGAQHGRGVMSVRDREIDTWSRPGFVTMTGGTIGWQIGVQAVDIVLLVMNHSGIDDLLDDKFTIGGTASLAVGPFGRTANVATDAKVQAQVLAYSRAQGLFAGATLDGAALHGDREANTTFYGKDNALKTVLRGPGAFLPVTGVADRWRQLLQRVSK